MLMESKKNGRTIDCNNYNKLNICFSDNEKGARREIRIENVKTKQVQKYKYLGRGCCLNFGNDELS